MSSLQAPLGRRGEVEIPNCCNVAMRQHPGGQVVGYRSAAHGKPSNQERPAFAGKTFVKSC
jgi:hypothetical protein